MTRIDAFSPLQSLLLFQALNVYGTDRESFDKASESLTHSDYFADAVASGSLSLTSESLQHVYLTLLKEEAKRELQASLDREEQAKNSDGASTSPKKRKVRSPVLPTIEAAKDHAHLVPLIIPKLYAGYRQRIIEEVRVDERRYDELMKEVKQSEESASITTSEAGQHVRQSNTKQPSTEVSQADDKTQDFDDRGVGHPSGNAVPPPRHVQEQAHQSLNPSADGAALPTSTVAPSLPPLQGPASATHKDPPPMQKSTIPQARQHPPRTQEPSPMPQASNRPSSPVVVPPPPGTKRPSFPPSSPWSPVHDSSRPASRPPLASPASSQPYTHDQLQTQPQLASTPHTAPHRASPSTQPGFAFSPYAAHSAPGPASHHLPRHGGVMLPPFQVQPQAPSSAHHAQLPRPAVVPPPPPPSHPSQPRPTPDIIRVQTDGRHMAGHPRTPSRPGMHSPLSGPRYSSLRRSDVVISPGSSTYWKVLSSAQSPAQQSRTERPRSRSISPLSDAEEEADTKAAPPQAQTVKQPRGRKPGRKPSARSKQSRAASKTPSGAPPSSRGRSQSTFSHADEHSVEGSQKIKDEVATPTASLKQDTDVDEAPTTRQSKRGASSKRKRADTEDQEANSATPVAATPVSQEVPPNTVTAVRDFNKVAQPILDSIRAHKHASIFETPVTESIAPGYSLHVRVPQDFTSIKKAVTAGGKAVKAALAGGASPGTTGGNSVTLPISEDLVPPKGIVNADQLEQEVMRIFANAALFNPGEDEIVAATREMSKEAERIFNAWHETEGRRAH